MATRDINSKILFLSVTAALASDVQRGVIHERFSELQEGSLILSVRTAADKFFVAWVKGSGFRQFTNVPAPVWQAVYNRTREVTKEVAPVRLTRYVQNLIDSGDVVPFNAVKRGKLIKYLEQGTFPTCVGMIEDENGKARQAYIIGAPPVGSKGVMSLMTSKAIIFTAD